MPRQARLDIPGVIYHVITRGINRSLIFKDKKDRLEFIKRLAEVLGKCECQCFAWVLMSNHIHLLLQPISASLSQIMSKLLTGYAVYFNRRHKRSGYLYQNRYKSILCQKDEYFMELIRYIHLNPVRAGIIKTKEELNRYPWSGHASILGKQERKWQSIKPVLEYFDKYERRALKKYCEFVDSGWKMGHREDLIGGGLRRSLGGWSGVWEAKKSKDKIAGDERILGESEFVEEVLRKYEELLSKQEEKKRRGYDILKTAEEICEKMGIRVEEILRRRRSNHESKARSLLAYRSYYELGISGKEIAKYLGISRSSVSGAIERGREINKRGF